jgi:hypothetical protein
LATISSPESTGHARGVVADDQDDGVPEVLELAQLLEHDRVPEVNVGGGRVEPELHPQRPALGKALLERPLRQAIHRVAGEMGRRPGGLGSGFCHPPQC